MKKYKKIIQNLIPKNVKPAVIVINSEIKDKDGGVPLFDKKTSLKTTDKKSLEFKNLFI